MHVPAGENPAVKAKLERALRSLREISARLTSLEVRVNGPQPMSAPENGAIQTIPVSYQHLSAELSEGAEIILKRLDNLATEM
jgi:hypothetical protein